MNKKIVITTILIAMLPLLFVPSVFADTTANTYATVYVTNTPPAINAIVVSPDPADPGNLLTVTVNATDPNDDIVSVVAVLDMGTPGNPGDDVTLNLVYNAGTGLYENTTYVLDSDATPGTWTAEVTVTDSGASTDTDTATFVVNSFVALSLQNTPIDFGNTSIGAEDRRADNGTVGNGYSGGTVKGFPLIIANDGNVDVNFELRGEDLEGQDNSAYAIAISNLKAWNANAIGSAFAMSTTYQSVGSTTNPGNNEQAYFWVTVPSGLPEQEYRGTVTVRATQA